VTTPPRPDQTSRPSIPLSPGGISIAQLDQQGLLTNADMVALGLQKDSTGQTQLSMGVPPGVPNITTSVKLFGTPGSSPYTLYTFPSNGRVWVASLSGTATPNAGYGTGPTVNVYAQLVTGSGITLAVIDMVIAATGIIDSKQSDVPWNGIDISAGDTLTLDVNNGVTPAMTVIRASGFVSHSIP
jgi:hypothetical protein